MPNRAQSDDAFERLETLLDDILVQIGKHRLRDTQVTGGEHKGCAVESSFVIELGLQYAPVLCEEWLNVRLDGLAFRQSNLGRLDFIVARLFGILCLSSVKAGYQAPMSVSVFVGTLVAVEHCLVHPYPIPEAAEILRLKIRSQCFADAGVPLDATQHFPLRFIEKICVFARRHSPIHDRNAALDPQLSKTL